MSAYIIRLITCTFWVGKSTITQNTASGLPVVGTHESVRWMYQPVSSLSGVVVITSAPSVKIHWYTPASDKAKLEIWSSLDLRTTSSVPSVMVILPPLTTCSPFLTHTTEGRLKLPEPTHLNTWLLPTVTATRLSGKLSLSAGFVTTLSVLVLAAGKEDHEPHIIVTESKTCHNSQCASTCCRNDHVTQVSTMFTKWSSV